MYILSLHAPSMVCVCVYISAWASMLLVRDRRQCESLEMRNSNNCGPAFLYVHQNMRIRNIFHKEHLNEFLRFCLVGIIATCIHYGIYLLLIKTTGLDGKFWINAAYFVGFIISWLCNFWLTARITFNTHVSVKRGIGFAITHGINYLLHLLFLNIFLALGIAEQIAPIPVYCCVVPINFILLRIVFKSNKIQ